MAIFGIDVKDAGTAIGAVGTLAKDLRAAITGKSILDPVAQAELEYKILAIEAESMRAQVAVNQAEAASPSMFISGWRPALGWVGAVAFAIQFLARPLAGAFGLSIPAMEIGELWPMLAGILGLGTLRTVEKATGVARK